jgi:hypothetical protein
MENLTGVEHRVRFDSGQNTGFSSFRAVVVPANYYLMLGDRKL